MILLNTSKRHRDQLKDIRRKEEAIKKEFTDFFLEFPKEYAEIKEKEEEAHSKKIKHKEHIIEGESKRIHNNDNN